MKLRDGFVVREIADSIVVVPTGDLLKDFQGMMTLNQSAQYVLELLSNEITEEALVHAFAEKYEVDEESAKTDVMSFVNILKEKKMLEE